MSSHGIAALSAELLGIDDWDIKPNRDGYFIDLVTIVIPPVRLPNTPMDVMICAIAEVKRDIARACGNTELSNSLREKITIQTDCTTYCATVKYRHDVTALREALGSRQTPHMTSDIEPRFTYSANMGECQIFMTTPFL